MPTWVELDAGPRLAERVLEEGIRWLRLIDAEDQDLLVLHGLPLLGLSLRGCERLRGSTLSALRGMPLQHLDLSGTSLVHTALAELATLPLQHLDLSRTPLMSLPLLRQALEARPEDMAARMVLSEVWEERYTFRWEEGYGDFWVEDEQPPELEEDPETPIPALSAEDLVEVELEDHERWAELRTACELYELDLSGLHPPLTGFQALPRSLRTLELAQTPFGDREAGVLSELSELRLLGLAGTAVHDLAPLAGLHELRALDLSHTPFRDLSPLIELPLRGLRVGGLLLAGGQFEELAALGSLESLAVHDSTLREDWLSGPARLPALRQLSLYRCELDRAGLAALAAGPLRELDLSRCRLGVDRLDLWRLDQLRLLRLSRTDLELEDLDRLRQLQQLELLGVGFVDLPRPELERLVEDLPGVQVELAFPEDG